MACIDVHNSSNCDCLKVDVIPLIEPIKISLEVAQLKDVIVSPLVEGLKLSLGVEELLGVVVSPLVESLKVCCGIVCDIAQLNYLNVSPEEVMWITDSEGIYYSVESNTDWIVE